MVILKITEGINHIQQSSAPSLIMTLRDKNLGICEVKEEELITTKYEYGSDKWGKKIPKKKSKVFIVVLISFFLLNIFSKKSAQAIAEPTSVQITDLATASQLMAITTRKTTTDESISKQIEALKRQLNNSNIDARISAVTALGQLGPPAIPTLINALKDINPTVRQISARFLVQMGDERAIEPLTYLIEDKNISTSDIAIDTLGKLRAIQALIKALEITDMFVRRSVARNLVKIGDEEVVQALTKTLEDESEALYKVEAIIEALEELNWQPQTEHEKIIYSIIKDQWPEVVQIGSPAVPTLINILNKKSSIDEHYKVKQLLFRMQAVIALGNIRDNRAFEPLIEALSDDESSVRIQAINALGKIGDERAIESMLKVLNGKEPEEQLAASFALSSICKPKDQNVDSLENTLSLNPQSEELLLKALGSSNFYYSSGARKTLERFQDTLSIESLIKALEVEDPTVLNEVIRIIGKRKDSRAVNSILRVMRNKKNEVFRVRMEAIKTLGEIGDERSIKPLIAVLRDKNEIVTVRDLAREALGKIDGGNEELGKIEKSKRKIFLWIEIGFPLSVIILSLLHKHVSRISQRFL